MTRSAVVVLCLAAALCVSLLSLRTAAGNVSPKNIHLVEADSRDFQYTGRIDFSHPKLPRFWAPGVYITARFRGAVL